MTTIAPQWLPEEPWSVIRVGEEPSDIYVRVGDDDWLEVKSGTHHPNEWLFDLVNGGEIDETVSYPWVNRRGYTLFIPDEL